MRSQYFVCAVFFLSIWGASPARLSSTYARQQDDQPPVEILNPHAGQILQGVVPITIRMEAEEFQSVRLEFGYEGDETQTWFLLFSSDRSSGVDPLAQWDTTTITDGDYRLRLTIWIGDGEPWVRQIGNLRVRNYTPYATDTSTPTSTPVPGDTPIPTGTGTPTETPHPPTVTPLPTNPAVLSEARVLTSVGRGVIITFLAFCIFGLYIGIRILLGLRQ